MILQLPATLGVMDMLKGPEFTTFTTLSLQPYWRCIVGNVVLSPGAVTGSATVGIDTGFGNNPLGMTWPATVGTVQLPFGFLCAPGLQPIFTNTADPNTANTIDGFEFNLIPNKKSRVGSRIQNIKRGNDFGRIIQPGSGTSGGNNTEYTSAFMVDFTTTSDSTHASEVDLSIAGPQFSTVQIAAIRVPAALSNNIRATFFFVLPPGGKWSTGTVGNAPTAGTVTQILL